MDVRSFRKIHRYLGLFVGVQLLLWTAGGLFFSLNPIEKVRGETEASEPAFLQLDSPLMSPAPALAELAASRYGIEIRSVTLRPHLGEGVYEIAYDDGGRRRWALADTRTGRLRSPITEDEAVAIARADYIPDVPVTEVALITEVGSGDEYRGRPLPAYRVSFDHPLGTRLYVSVERGVVTARRNDRWRWFDLFWMLHIMDYEDRDDFNTWWLQFAAVLGFVTILSGFALFAVTSPRLRRLFGRS
jgi:hypothetical protein